MTSTATISELWMLHPPPKSFSIPLEVYNSYLHVHFTPFYKVPWNSVKNCTLQHLIFISESDCYLSHIPLYRSTDCSTIPHPFHLIHIPFDAGDSPLSVDTSLVAMSLLGTLLSSPSHIFIVSHWILSITSSFDSSTIPLPNRVTRIPLPSLVPLQQC